MAVALPPFVCLAILLVWYIGKTVMEVRRIYKQEERKVIDYNWVAIVREIYIALVQHKFTRDGTARTKTASFNAPSSRNILCYYHCAIQCCTLWNDKLLIP